MQIVIPMSGFGERFRAEGYEIPKPLIVVDDKPIISHVVDLFPGDHRFVFVCNAEHLESAEWAMRPLLESLAIDAVIVPISPHKLGPVGAVLAAEQYIDSHQPTVVNYADFSCFWDFESFLVDINRRSLAGSVPAYRGFHPHSGGSTNYAYIVEKNMTLQKIREKEPFTDSKVHEFASSGTYYFATGALMLELFRRQVDEGLSVGGEFYVSTAMGLLQRTGAPVGVFELEHFMQWGTPADLEAYREYSEVFRSLTKLESCPISVAGSGPALVLAGGSGTRFAREGYVLSKPLLPIGGESIVAQVRKAAEDLDSTFAIASASDVAKELAAVGFSDVLDIPQVSSGQAQSASLLVDHISSRISGKFTVLPCDTLFADTSGLAPNPDEDAGDFLAVWVRRPDRFALDHPEQFGWVWQIENSTFVSVKEAPRGPNAKVMAGAFTFSSVEFFSSLVDALGASGASVNGEVYLDSLVQMAVERRAHVRIFEPEIAVSLGTPREYEAFRYWQRCFDLWPTHPYSLELDPFIRERMVGEVRLELDRSFGLQERAVL